MCTQPLFFCAHAADVSEDSGVEYLAQSISNVTVSYRQQGKLFTLSQNPSMGGVDSDIGYDMGFCGTWPNWENNLWPKKQRRSFFLKYDSAAAKKGEC